MEDSAIIKPLREQSQMCIKYLRSQCVNIYGGVLSAKVVHSF